MRTLKLLSRLKIFSLTCLNIFVQVVDVDPSSGDVTAVAVVLIQAAILTKSRNQQYTMSSLHRMQYQASFKFCWNIDSGHYYIIDSDPLKEISGYKVIKPVAIIAVPPLPTKERNKIACFRVKLSWTRGSFFIFVPFGLGSQTKMKTMV